MNNKICVTISIKIILIALVEWSHQSLFLKTNAFVVTWSTKQMEYRCSSSSSSWSTFNNKKNTLSSIPRNTTGTYTCSGGRNIHNSRLSSSKINSSSRSATALIANDKSNSGPKTRLHASSSSTSSCNFFRNAAAVALPNSMKGILYLLLSSSVGIYSNLLLERIFHVTSSDGLVITLLTAALLSNAGMIPSSHPIYDVTWSTFLPASLAFLLIGTTTTTTTTTSTATANPIQKKGKDPTSNKLITVGVAFIIASLGSIIGCSTSFFLCYYNYYYKFILRHQQPQQLGSIIRKFQQHLFLSPNLAALAAGCLCASYIGGSVNFFATAHFVIINNILFQTNNNHNNNNNMESNNLITSMAGADLILMAFYFIILSTLKENKRMISWFSSNTNSTTSSLSLTPSSSNYIEYEDSNDSIPPLSSLIKGRSITNGTSTSTIARKGWWWSRVAANINEQLSPLSNKTTKVTCFIVLLVITSSLVHISNIVERYARIPGSSTVSITVLASIVSLVLNKNNKRLTPWKNIIRTQSSQLSNICFHIFFASLGYSANVVQAAPMYGPAALLFGSIALLVHIAVTFIGCWIWNKLLLTLPRTKNKGNGNLLIVEDIMVASNAAIGGPATAASFAGSFTRISDAARNALIISGTFYGVVGYAIGTSIGVALTRILLACIPTK